MPNLRRIGQLLTLLAGMAFYAGCSSSQENVRLCAREASMEAVLSHCACCAKHYRMSGRGSEIMLKYTKREYLLGRLRSWEGVEMLYESADANKDMVVSLEEVIDFYERNK
jgi:hypothetical protein